MERPLNEIDEAQYEYNLWTLMIKGTLLIKYAYPVRTEI